MGQTPGFPAADDGGPFGPRQAAAVLDQAGAQARRAFTPGTSALFAFRAVLVLVVFGGCWLSVRGQRPYSGPTGAIGPIALALVAVNVGWTAWEVRRAAPMLIVGAAAAIAAAVGRLWSAAVAFVLIVVVRL
jgi:hypothetical protein